MRDDSVVTVKVQFVEGGVYTEDMGSGLESGVLIYTDKRIEDDGNGPHVRRNMEPLVSLACASDDENDGRLVKAEVDWDISGEMYFVYVGRNFLVISQDRNAGRLFYRRKTARPPEG